MLTIARMPANAPLEAFCLIRYDNVGWYVLDERTHDAFLILGTLFGCRETHVS